MINPSVPHIVIVGGGAGGIELAAMLGKKLGKTGKAKITLVDSSPTHLWKPLLHEVAAGTLNSYEDELNYMAYASSHYFQFSLGTLMGLNQEKKEIILAPIVEDHHILIPERQLSYDVLVIAVGSVANDFNIPGVREHCLFLDNRDQADAFHKHLLNSLMQLQYQKNNAISEPDSPAGVYPSMFLAGAEDDVFNIAIVGGGATGIELAAELHYSIRLMEKYGVTIDPNRIHFDLIEAADKLVPALPERLSRLILEELKKLGIHVYLNEKVTRVTEKGLYTQSGKMIPANIMVWTAGIKAPEFLKNLGLKVNRLNQLEVKPTLQTITNDSIFAFGDCASCPQPGSSLFVPPRAQAAHQQAKFLVKAITHYLENKPIGEYQYHDYGSLITVSQYKIVGNLMGRITKSLMIEGFLARLFYLSLYKKHLAALYGFWRVGVLSLANLLSRRVRPRLKLH